NTGTWQMKADVGADHRGSKPKEGLFQLLEGMGSQVEDFRAYEFDPRGEDTFCAEKVASVVARAKSRGIMIGRPGVGVDLVANKVDGVRAAIGKEVKQVEAGRRDDDMNVLVLASDFTTYEEAKNMLKAFLSTDFDGKARHKRRLEDVKRIEE